jgi:hypothetical protein
MARRVEFLYKKKGKRDGITPFRGVFQMIIFAAQILKSIMVPFHCCFLRASKLDICGV